MGEVVQRAGRLFFYGVRDVLPLRPGAKFRSAKETRALLPGERGDQTKWNWPPRPLRTTSATNSQDAAWPVHREFRFDSALKYDRIEQVG